MPTIHNFFVQDEKSLNEILNELHSFGEVAGPKINKDKTFLYGWAIQVNAGI